MDPDCVFCGIWRAHESGVHRALRDTPIADLGSYFLVPALGPLGPGHVLLVAKRHVASLAALGATAIDEYEVHVGQARSRFGPELLEAEHGSTGFRTGGSCIDHVHVALLPNQGYAVSMLDEKLRLLSRTGPLVSALPTDRPYVYLRGDNELRVFDGQGVPSQLVRRELACLQGHEEWDWALFDRVDLIGRSVDLWRPVFPGR